MRPSRPAAPRRNPTRRPNPSRRRLRLVPCLLVPLAIAVSGPLSAHAAEPIEAVWAFNGGEVAIVPDGNGTYKGIVDSPTTFARCPHAVGEVMWSDVRQQTDGSYWGLHQWFYETAGCPRNPTLGPTAWRVLSATNGSRYLKVCFSDPGTSQPTIARNGQSTGVTYDCYRSALLAPVPTAPAPSSPRGRVAFERAVSLPGAHRCVSRRLFTIHLHNPAFDPIREAVVRLRGRRVAVRRRGRHFSATIDLRGLPRGTFTVTVTLRTVLGHRLAGSRTYHTCVRSSAPKAPRHRADRPKGSH